MGFVLLLFIKATNLVIYGSMPTYTACFFWLGLGVILNRYQIDYYLRSKLVEVHEIRKSNFVYMIPIRY